MLPVLGAFIDFLLGKPGQKKEREWLEDWWLRLNEERFSNFGVKKANWFVGILDRYCGRSLFNGKRWLWALIVLGSAFVIDLGLFVSNFGFEYVPALLRQVAGFSSANVVATKLTILLATIAISIGIARVL